MALSRIEARFLHDIRQNPAADAPRLIYADYLDETGQSDRAEFIRIQCARARLPGNDPRRADLLVREKQLLADHATTWAGEIATLVERFEFHRGFIESVTLSAQQFLAAGDRLMPLAPLREVRLFALEGHRMLMTMAPALRNVQELDLCGNDVDDQTAFALAQSSYLDRLRRLDLGYNRLTDRGVRELASSPHLNRLRELRLNDNHQLGLGTAAVLGLPERLASLRHLDLSGNSLDATAVRALLGPRRRIRYQSLFLSGNPIGDEGLGLFVHAIGVPQMTARHPDLDLTNMQLTATGMRYLAAAPGLENVRQLDLAGNRMGDDGLIALLESPFLRSLRELLVPSNGIGDPGATALATSRWLDPLEVIQLSNNHLGPSRIAALQRAFEQGPSYHWRKQLIVDNNVPLPQTVEPTTAPPRDAEGELEFFTMHPVDDARHPSRAHFRQRPIRGGLPNHPTADFDDRFG